MLASTIQFTTNTPTPTQTNHTKAITRIDGIRSGALLQNPDSMPSPKTPSLFAKKTEPNTFKRIL